MTAGVRTGLSVGESLAELVEVCARQADELAGQAEAAQQAVADQLRAIEAGRAADAVGAGCWVAATLRVLAGSLGELHTTLDEAAQLARRQHPTRPGPAAAPRVPCPRAAEHDATQARREKDRDEVVAAAVEALYGLRHRLGPDVARSLAGIWACASAARYGAPADEFSTDPSLFAGHDVAGCEDGEA